MDLIQIFNQLSGEQRVGIGVIFLILSFIKIPKVEVNIWSLILGFLGKALNRDVKSSITSLNQNITDLDEKLSDLNKRFNSHLDDKKMENILSARRRILRFNDEIVQCKYHSMEHYNEIMGDIDDYEQYCIVHPEYPNNKAVMAIENIKSNYQIEMEKIKKNNEIIQSNDANID